jgi:Zn-finger domain-containing protein
MTTEQNEFKTGHELLQMIEKIEPWIAEKIKINIIDQKNEDLLLSRYGNAQAMVRQIFVWGQTKQGHEFWAEFSHPLRFIK